MQELAKTSTPMLAIDVLGKKKGRKKGTRGVRIINRKSCTYVGKCMLFVETILGEKPFEGIRIGQACAAG